MSRTTRFFCHALTLTLLVPVMQACASERDPAHAPPATPDDEQGSAVPTNDDPAPMAPDTSGEASPPPSSQQATTPASEPQEPNPPTSTTHPTQFACKVTRTTVYSAGKESIDVYSYDAATRRLSSTWIEEIFDERGRAVSRGQPSGEWRHDYRYDEHDSMVELIYLWQGVVHDSNSQRYRPVYENGRVASVQVETFDKSRSYSMAFKYDAAGRLIESTRVDGARGSSVKYQYDAAGRLVESRNEFELTRYLYDGAGRLTEMSVDGFNWAMKAPDGTPESRSTWSYDAQGNLVRFSVDGTTATDNPYTDGKPDDDSHFTPGCTALMEHGGRFEIFGLPTLPPRPY